MWHYVALSKIHKKQENMKKHVVFAVALCGTIKKHIKWQKTAVALCGTMWHYPKMQKKVKKM